MNKLSKKISTIEGHKTTDKEFEYAQTNECGKNHNKKKSGKIPVCIVFHYGLAKKVLVEYILIKTLLFLIKPFLTDNFLY